MIKPTLILISAATVIAAIFDIRERRIPNWLTYPLLSISIFWIDFTTSLFIMAAIALLLFGRDLIGAGDIKLALVIAIWSHHYSWSHYWILISFLLAGVSAALALMRGDRDALPFAPYLASGFLISNLIL